MIQIDIDLTPFFGFMDVVERTLGEPEPILMDMLEYYRNEAQPAIFEAHANNKIGGGQHRIWDTLSDSYKYGTLKRFSLHPTDILQLTGEFAKDITTGSAYTIVDIFSTQNLHTLYFGSSRDYPVWAGAGNGGNRQAMYITPETAQRMHDIVQHHISEAIVRARTA